MLMLYICIYILKLQKFRHKLCANTQAMRLVNSCSSIEASQFPSHYASAIRVRASRTVKFNQHHQDYHYAAMGCKKDKKTLSTQNS